VPKLISNEKKSRPEKAWAEYQAQYRGVDEKIARLKALRLAKEAEAAEAAAKGKKETQTPNKLSSRSRWNRNPRKVLSPDLQPHE
jgi:hypothetical protein